jgi:cellulose synthase/poly-beta-1,6-N-acetylglucosamine synthase-like glycosyltransferase
MCLGISGMTTVLTVLSIAAGIMACAVAIPVIVLLVEIAAGVLPPRRAGPDHGKGRRARVAVLVPAHNESRGIRSTIEDIAAQLGIGDRVLVVADNCTDDTAVVAVAAGAEVIERRDLMQVGKGYALDWGLRHLSADPPDVVIMIDADCRLGAGAIERLTASVLATGRPVQALDLMTAPERSAVNHRVAEFAWRAKNWIRPLGLLRLGLPCQLMGTGMAFPWEVIRTADLASGRIVEDLRLGLDLALAGSPPVFCPSALVTSHFPVSVEGATTQRQRWEHGHIHMICTLAPRFFWLAVARRNPSLAVLVLDLAVPPLAMLALILIVTSFVAGATALLGGSFVGLVLAAVNLAAFGLAVLLLWFRCGRDLLPPSSMPSIAVYVFAKLALYRSLLKRGAVATWIRTDRTT